MSVFFFFIFLSRIQLSVQRYLKSLMVHEKSDHEIEFQVNAVKHMLIH